MKYKAYGNTGISVSQIGFGGMRFEDHNDLDKSAGLVIKAYERGINYFDTAPYYCEDKSQDIFGMALKQMRKMQGRKPFYVSTKSGGRTAGDVRRDLEKSLDRLGLECIDFYHVWCVMDPEDWNDRQLKGVLKEFEKIQEEGLARHICVSTHMAGDDIGAMLDVYPFAGMLVGYSIMNFPYRQKGLDAAFGRGMGLAVMNPLGGGIIPQHPERFSFVKTQTQETVVEAALRFLMNDERITLALVGFANEQELDEACRAAEDFKTIEPETVERIKANLSDSFDSLCTGCSYCLNCPEDIPIPKILDAYNHLILTGDKEAVFNRMKWHWDLLDPELIHRCIDCEQCEDVCTQKLEIRERMRVVESILRENEAHSGAS